MARVVTEEAIKQIVEQIPRCPEGQPVVSTIILKVTPLRPCASLPPAAIGRETERFACGNLDTFTSRCEA